MKKLLSPFPLVMLIQFFFVQIITAQDKVTPANALQHYIHTADPAYQWEVKDSFEIQGVKGYDLLLTSQKWRQYTWRHQLTVLSPKENNYDGALLFITGGSDENEQPNW
ncbi:MAG: PhoPQ-activated protein PqaA family protein, partial [Ginsengibacter sp.]